MCWKTPVVVAALPLVGAAANSPACTVEVSPGRGRGADQRPVRAVGGVVPGDRVSVTGQPQPARRGRGHAAGQAGRVVDVVPLHPHAVRPGDHHRRVGRALRGVLLDDDPGLGPRLEAAWRRLEPAIPCADDELAGQRRHLHGDRAVPGQRLVREVEHVLDRLTARPGRLHRAGGRAGPAAGSMAHAAPAADVSAEERTDGNRHDRDEHRDHPAAHGAELGPLGVHQVPEPFPLRGPGERSGVTVSAVMTSPPPGTRRSPWLVPCRPVRGWPGGR